MQRRPEVQGLVGPLVVAEGEEALDLVGELRRLSSVPLAEALVLERAVEALDHPVRLEGAVADADVLAPTADVLPTRRIPTAQHS